MEITLDLIFSLMKFAVDMVVEFAVATTSTQPSLLPFQ